MLCLRQPAADVPRHVNRNDIADKLECCVGAVWGRTES